MMYWFGRKGRVMSRHILLTVFLTVPIACAVEPPTPDPQHPVDFAGWLEREYTSDLHENAAGLYRQADAAFRKADGPMVLMKWRDLCAPDKDNSRTKLTQWLRDNPEVLDKFTIAATKEGCYFEQKFRDGFLVSGEMVDYPDMYRLAQAIALRGEFRLVSGNIEGALEDVLSLLGAARHLESQPSLMCYGTALRTRKVAYSLLMKFPARAPRADFAALLARVEKSDPGPPRPTRQLTIRRVVTWDSAQRVLKPYGDGRYVTEGYRHYMDERGFGRRGEYGIIFGPETWENVLSGINEYFDALDKVARMDYPAGLDAAAELFEQAKASANNFVSNARNNGLVIRQHAQALAHYRGTILLLQLHAYRATHGRWPPDLDAFCSDPNSPLRIDPFSGRPFIYAVDKGEPRLYSVSENRTDDGGVVAPDVVPQRWKDRGDFVFWPPAD
jgi:hypothetical protein